MEIIVAKNAGFCFGVARATAAVEKEMREKLPGERIFTLGRLIHNEIYNQRLAANGVTVLAMDCAVTEQSMEIRQRVSVKL